MQTQDMVIEALIEIPVGSRNKYEYDATRQRIRLDRVLYLAALVALARRLPPV